MIVLPSRTFRNNPGKRTSPDRLIEACWVDVDVCLLKRSDVGGLQAFGALLYGELHLLALIQVAETLTLNGRVVDKHVRSIRLSDEPITLCPAEPLHRTRDALVHENGLLS